MDLTRLPQPRRKREKVPFGAAGYALPLIIALAFHGAFLIVLARIVVSIPTETVREIGIDVSTRAIRRIRNTGGRVCGLAACRTDSGCRTEGGCPAAGVDRF